MHSDIGLQLKGTKPLQFVSWWNIFMKKTAVCLPAAVPAIPTRLQAEQNCMHMTIHEYITLMKDSELNDSKHSVNLTSSHSQFPCEYNLDL